jgi:aerobic carbon-monoxide dehydrogenase small subunit
VVRIPAARQLAARVAAIRHGERALGGRWSRCATTVARNESMTFRFTVNGAPVEVEATGSRRLLDVLREDLSLTGTKEGCGEGECGACSVLLDGAVVDACLVPVSQAQGASVQTVEGLAAEGTLNSLQQAFLETGGAQCGICTPGMLMAGEAFLASGADPTEENIREAIAGNLCRCTGYTKIIDAIALAAERRTMT